MKRFFSYLSLIIIIAFILTAAYLHFTFRDKENILSASPIPDFLNLSKNNQVRLLDLWFPNTESVTDQEFDTDDLTAKSVLMYDLETDKAIFEKNPRDKMPMASLTKIMTAIIALENRREDDQYTVIGANLVGEDSMGLSAGEVLSFEELLYGLMLPSGNDAAEVLASNYAQGRTAFIQAMNDKARALGLTDTVFSNPSGLQGDGIQHTTTYDLLVITRYALDNFPLFRDVVGTSEYQIAQTGDHSAYNLISETNLLTTYPGVKGVKTGYTPEAGLCLVTYLEYGGHKIIGILLNSENRRGEMKNLLDYSLKSLGKEPPEFEGGI